MGFSETQVQYLTLRNICTDGYNVAFKVKTTALKAYLVRPSSAVLKPGETMQVSIMLQKLTEVPANYMHRFLVQALKTSVTQVETREQWFQLAKEFPPQEMKLSVVFPDANGGGQRGSSGNAEYDRLLNQYKSLEGRKRGLENEVAQLRGG